jgi:hypothetical protein
MARYTVHIRDSDLERSVFVRDGWSWGAFLFGPFWLARHRHWISFALTMIVMLAALFAIIVVPIGGGAKAGVMFLLAVLWGLEGPSLRRFALRRAGYIETALAAGGSLEEIEGRVFTELTVEKPREASPASPPQVSTPGVVATPLNARVPIIGLFPEARKP